MKLNLGVNDVLEVVNKSEPPKPLYDVALALESKYGVFSKFAEIHHDDIESELVKSVNGQLANMLAGQPAGNPFQEGLEKIENQFQEFLTLEELAGVSAGVPTKMAAEGRSRIKGAKRRGQSFVDTGTLRTHLRIWISDT